jgi:hypothetical protein
MAPTRADVFLTGLPRRENDVHRDTLQPALALAFWHDCSPARSLRSSHFVTPGLPTDGSTCRAIGRGKVGEDLQKARHFPGFSVLSDCFRETNSGDNPPHAIETPRGPLSQDALHRCAAKFAIPSSNISSMCFECDNTWNRVAVLSANDMACGWLAFDWG